MKINVIDQSTTWEVGTWFMPLQPAEWINDEGESYYPTHGDPVEDSCNE